MRENQWPSYMMRLPVYTAEDGSLCPIEFSKIPFIPKRIFYVKDCAVGEMRGEHAHKTTQQVLICVNGLIDVVLYDGISSFLYRLHQYDAVYVPAMVWDYQVFQEPNSILLSIASTSYDPADYITNKETFRELVT